MKRCQSDRGGGTNLAGAWAIIAALSVAGLPCQAGEPTQEALRFGSIATLAPLCGLRDDTWARDLRRAELQALAQSMSANEAAATLSYAEDEAVETFAETKPRATCDPLTHDPDLPRADEIVDAFRKGAGV
jgi:hypothetical protein